MTGRDPEKPPGSNVIFLDSYRKEVPTAETSQESPSLGGEYTIEELQAIALGSTSSLNTFLGEFELPTGSAQLSEIDRKRCDRQLRDLGRFVGDATVDLDNLAWLLRKDTEKEAQDTATPTDVPDRAITPSAHPSLGDSDWPEPPEDSHTAQSALEGLRTHSQEIAEILRGEGVDGGYQRPTDTIITVGRAMLELHFEGLKSLLEYDSQ